MSDTRSRVPVETLLAHRDWVRALALRIARDAWDADDLEQATWAAAVARPPADGSSPRGWLATVMRRLAHNFRRDAARRRGRELAAPLREPAPSTDELAARADAEQIVIRAVLALEEPYRSVVLLRFFEGLSARAVAARLGVPLDTVRTRLRRALARLRDELDGRAGGVEVWCAAFFGARGMETAATGTPGGAGGGRLATTAAALVVGAALGLAGAAAVRDVPNRPSDAVHAAGDSARPGSGGGGDRSVARRAESAPGRESPGGAASLGPRGAIDAAPSVSERRVAPPGVLVEPKSDAPAAATASRPSRAWRLRVERPGWSPEVVTGTLVLGARGDRPFGDVFLNEVGSRAAAPLAIADAAGGRLDATFDFLGDTVKLSGRFDATSDAFAGSMEWSHLGRVFVQPTTGGVVSPGAFDAATDASPWAVERDPAHLGMDTGGLARIVAEAESSDTEALVVVKDGSVVCRRTFGRARGRMPCWTMTESVASLAIAMLLEEGKIESLDAPLSRWYADFEDGRRAKITLRHVVTHTTGLDASAPRWREIDAAPDQLAYARKIQVIDDPGSAFDFDSLAAQLLSGVIEQAAGEPADRYLERKLFTPLGWRDWAWARDAAGNVLTGVGLSADPEDLVRLGEMLAAGGSWHGERLVPASWSEELTKPANRPATAYSLGWELRRDTDREEVTQTAAGLAALRTAGFAATDRLSPLTGRAFPSRWAFWAAVDAEQLLSPEESRTAHQLASRGIEAVEGRARVLGFMAHGRGGQFLLVYPAWRLVVVRMRRGLGDGDSVTGYQHDDYQRKLSFFPGLVESAVVR